MNELGVLFVGLMLGMKHATEADHLAAVATLVAGRGTRAQTLRLGVAWGLGHTLTLLLFAGTVLVLGQVIPPALEQLLETVVGVMLVLLGADMLRRLVREQPPVARAGAAPRWPLRALMVGMVHGLAGSAALVVLSLQAVPSAALGLTYIVLFGAGSIVGMVLLSMALAVPLRASAQRLRGWHHAVVMLVGVGSCALGLYVVWDVGWLAAVIAA